MINRMIQLSNNPEDQIFKKSEEPSSQVSFLKVETSATQVAASSQQPGVRTYFVLNNRNRFQKKIEMSQQPHFARSEYEQPNSSAGFVSAPKSRMRLMPTGKFISRTLSIDEKTALRKILQNIVNFLEEDKIPALELFGRYDSGNTGYIGIKEFE
jgi:hypothetical protein